MNTTQHRFSEVPNIDIPRSLFKRPSNLKTTIGVDYLYPIYCSECLPADSWKFSAQFFGRLTTPIVPIMDNLYLDVFFFAVPIRLIDKNWPKVMGERVFGDAGTEYTVPELSNLCYDEDDADYYSFPLNLPGSLSDYLGLPVQDIAQAYEYKFCPYWHRAYNLIWNEWFMDGNLQTPAPVAGVYADGTVNTEDINQYKLLKRCKRHDYFTSCLPTPQRGDPVTIPLAGTAAVVGNGKALGLTAGTDFAGDAVLESNYAALGAGSRSANGDVGDVSGALSGSWSSSHKIQLGVSADASKSGLSAILSNVTATDINDLYAAVALQKLLYRDNVSGYTRMIEIIKGHFNVDSPDLRALRPEYLGGFSQPLNVTSVPQTSATDATSPQGNLSAFVTVNQNAHWIKSFTEHCVILGLANLRADLTYSQGLPRMFSRKTRFDFYWPELANLGEQSVLNKEIYLDGSSDDDKVFGYQERWSEYRYQPNQLTGLFRPNVAANLSYWHLAQNFANRPQLNAEFIEENVPISRVLAVQNEPPLILDCYFDCECARPLPLYSIPGLGRRF